ncbi:hypothetical protein BDZ97DRAFT_345820 [Flammula alnicola]|nr:hypothetical protein BDZ97DRAFT_345820 [Flammula alnicola]
MPPYFGPLSAERPELTGLSKAAALITIRGQIRHAIRQIAPPMPKFHPPHNHNHDETGPWLWLGTAGQLGNAGRWYQECKTCDDPVVLQFITDPLDLCLLTGKSTLARLFDIYHEIQQYPDNKQARHGIKRKCDDFAPSSAATRVVKRRRGVPPASSSSSMRTQPAPFPFPSPLRESFD